MSTHTREPWHTYGNPQNAIGSAEFPYIGGFFGSECGESEANAARTIACVNACEGIAEPRAFVAAVRAVLAVDEEDDRARAVDEALGRVRALMGGG